MKECFVYKGDRKPDYYLYLAREFDVSDTCVPESVLSLMGELELVLEFELSPNRKLAQADPHQVLTDIESQGFYLQIPNKDRPDEEEQYFN